MSAIAEDEVVDLDFALAGEALPADHAHALWLALRPLLPWMAEEPGAGIHPVRGAVTEAGELLLARRARLVLRLPASRADAARRLEGVPLEVAGRRLALGPARLRALAPAGTLHTRLVASEAADELAFCAELAAELVREGAQCRFICGRKARLSAAGGDVRGHSVVLHGVPPAQSLRLQAHGLGPKRWLGCGILVPHKIIAGLD